VDLEQLLAIVRRHVWACTAVLVLTVVAMAMVPGRVAPDYEMTGNVILLSPSTLATGISDEEVEVNPWSRFGGAESGAAAALSEVLRSERALEIVAADERVESFVAAVNAGNGAIINLTVRASSAEASVAAYDKALKLLTDELAARQQAAGATPATWLRAEVLTRPDRPEELPGSTKRVMLAVGGLGVVAAVSLAIALDTVVTSRRARRPETADVPPVTPLARQSFVWESVIREDRGRRRPDTNGSPTRHEVEPKRGRSA
jgi:uncharacterized protein involved in exopolysaccharide biosynthesis